jgi:hypothetical protein
VFGDFVLELLDPVLRGNLSEYWKSGKSERFDK